MTMKNGNVIINIQIAAFSKQTDPKHLRMENAMETSWTVKLRCHYHSKSINYNYCHYDEDHFFKS